ncbi:unnamed protein product [Ectocarpus sp. 13 AM-2016]
MAWRYTRVSASRNVTRLRSHRAISSAPAGLGDKAAGWEYDHDVLVVGGGIVGCTLACRLAKDLSSTTPSTSGLPPLSTGKDDGGGNDGGRRRRRRRPAVGLIEARPPPSLEAALARGSPDPRVYSLAPSSVEILGKLGVWDAGGGVLKGRSQPFGGMQVWDDRGAGHLRFDGEGKGGKTAALGFISEHGVIHSSLFERVRELEADGSVELACPAQVKRVTFPPVGAGGATGPLTVTVETASGETSDTTCRLLVAADGGDSKVAKMMGLSSFGWGYGQRAVVATVKLAESHGEIAFQRYLSRGPLAMLPLPGEKLASLVWSTTPEHAESLKSMSPTEFVKEVNDALRLPPTIGTSPSSSAEPASSSAKVPPFAGDHGLFGGVSSLAALPFAAASALGEGVAKSAEGVAGALAGLSLGLQEGAGGGGRGGFCTPPEAIEIVTPRLGFDLSLRQAHKYTGARMALVGDAAHTVHPMAGQGLNLGIADADALARAVLEGRLSGTDVGSKTLLGRYEEERKTEALVMMGALDVLHRLFGSDARAVAAARSAGLSALNAAGPLKRRLARHAMGGK